MAAKKTTRTHTKTVGRKPHTGRRYVQNGKVRIEWSEGGKRRSRTVGPDAAPMRERADQLLKDLLADQRKPRVEATAQSESSGEPTLRGLALGLLDAADMIADGIRNAAREIIRDLTEPDDESAASPADPPNKE